MRKALLVLVVVLGAGCSGGQQVASSGSTGGSGTTGSGSTSGSTASSSGSSGGTTASCPAPHAHGDVDAGVCEDQDGLPDINLAPVVEVAWDGGWLPPVHCMAPPDDGGPAVPLGDYVLTSDVVSDQPGGYVTSQLAARVGPHAWNSFFILQNDSCEGVAASLVKLRVPGEVGVDDGGVWAGPPSCGTGSPNFHGNCYGLTDGGFTLAQFAPTGLLYEVQTYQRVAP